MAASDQRIEEILSALEIIKTKLPNGELEAIKKHIQSLSEDQKLIKEDLEYFKKRLFNPDDGVIVRINKNTDELDRFSDNIEEIPELKNQIKNLESWQGNITKAMWIIFTAITGIIISLILAAFKK